MPANEPRRSVNIPVWGVLFLFFGVVLLLQSVGVLDWEIWGTLWKFWPVFIVVAGLNILFRRRRPWLVGLITLAILGVCLWIAILQHSPTLAHDLRHAEGKYSMPLNGIERVDARIVYSAGGNILIGQLDARSQNLVEVVDSHEFEQNPSAIPPESRPTLVADFKQAGGVASVSLEPINQEFWSRWRAGWRISFSQQVPLNLDIHCDGSYIALDLQDLKINEVNLKTDACHGHLVLPAHVSTVNINSDVSNLEIEIPQGVFARIQPDVTLSMFNIDRVRFPQQGDSYESPGYDSATDKLLVKITCDVGRLTIK